MKTAMQELIKYVEMFDNPDPNAVGTILLAIKFQATTLREKEKEQMIDFAMQMHKIDCSKTGTDLLLDEAQAYYNQTYNQNK